MPQIEAPCSKLQGIIPVRKWSISILLAFPAESCGESARRPVRFRPIAAILLIAFGAFWSCAGHQTTATAETPAIQSETPPGTNGPQPEPAAEPSAIASQAGQESGQDEKAGRIRFMYEDVYFKRGSIEIDPAASELLDRKAQWLRDHPEAKVVIEGHTDYRGSREYNLALGDRRAGAVKSYLMRRGIARERLVAVSYGREKPAVAGRTERDRAKNRRVHFVIEAQ